MCGKRILIVDDEPTVVDFVGKVLRRSGFECHAAEDAGQALAEMNRQRADLVITDIHMPGSDGTWLLKTVKQQWPDVPVIMLTGDGEADVAVACIKSGASDYLVKPIEIAQLLSAVHSALGTEPLPDDASGNDGANGTDSDHDARA